MRPRKARPSGWELDGRSVEKIVLDDLRGEDRILVRIAQALGVEYGR
jgi:hypothetical protein